MKKINIKLFTAALAVVLLAGMAIIFYACKKDAVLNNITGSDTEFSSRAHVSSELQRLYSQLPTPNYGNITLVNGDILKFESSAHHDQVYDALNDLCEAWTDLFIQTYDTGDEEALDSIIEVLGFDENLPLYKFIEKYKMSHPSLEEAVLAEEEWLARGGNGNPPIEPVTQCPIEQTLLSRYHEYCIGNTICQLRPNGCEIHIPTSNIKMLPQIRNMSVEELLSCAKEVPHGDPPPPYPPIYIPPPYNLDIYPGIPPPNPGGGGGGGGDCGCNRCYCTTYQNEFQQANGNGHKFALSYYFRARWLDEKPKTTVTMKNYKAKKGEWVKDYGSYCRLGFSTKLYDSAGLNECISKGRDGKTGNNTKAFSKSKSKTFNYNFHDYSITDDISNSYIACRHKGIEFKFNPRGVAVP